MDQSRVSLNQTAELICSQIRTLQKEKESVIFAIDGRCGSGKSTLAAKISTMIDCNVFAMDDFFLRLEQRTKERYLEPGGNVDRERFLEEVLLPLKQGDDVHYRPFDCQTFRLGQEKEVLYKKVNIVEGSYSCHPELYPFYDRHIFLTLDREEQLKRILKRNGEEKLQLFIDKWIPLEEKYFKSDRIEERCEDVYQILDEERK